MVYVDKIQIGIPKGYAQRYGHRWCHLWADNTEELIIFAFKIGLKRTWFQDKPRFPHFDLTESFRLRAVEAGATEVSLRSWILKSRLTRSAG